MFQIDFNSFDHNFCESTLYSSGRHPEYVNSTSSLFISLVGLFGLTRPNISYIMNILYSSLFVNGITSCFYHYNNTIGWGLLDRMSMVLIAISSTYLFVKNIHVFLKLDKWPYYNILAKYIHVIIISYFTILFTVAGLHIENLFNTLFGLFLASIAIFMFLVDKHQKELDIPEPIVKIGWKGVIYIALSGLFWIVTEVLCHRIGLMKYLHGHMWWHIFVSYGGYLVSLVPNYLHLILAHDKEKYKKTDEHNKEIIIKYKFGVPYLDYK